jgi:hypothetical protein
MTMPATRIGALLLLSLAGPSVLGAQASPYVPNLDPAYVDLDLLVVAGLIQEIIAGERP